jgi:hypothetical protein
MNKEDKQQYVKKKKDQGYDDLSFFLLLILLNIRYHRVTNLHFYAKRK